MSLISDLINGGASQIGGLGSVVINQAVQGNIATAIDTAVNGAGDLITNALDRGGANFGDGVRGANARSDAVQSWCWYCLPPVVGNTGSPTLNLFTSIIPNGIQGSLTLPWYYVQTANLPLRNVNTEPVSRNGHPIHYPESYSVDGLSLGLFLDHSGTAYKWIKAWESLVLSNRTAKNVNNQGLWNLPATYKKDINFVITGVDKSNLINIRYIGCYPKNVSAFSLNYTASEAMVAEVAFSVDDIDIVVSSNKSLLDNLAETATGYVASGLTGAASNLANNILG